MTKISASSLMGILGSNVWSGIVAGVFFSYLELSWQACVFGGLAAFMVLTSIAAMLITVLDTKIVREDRL